MSALANAVLGPAVGCRAGSKFSSSNLCFVGSLLTQACLCQAPDAWLFTLRTYQWWSSSGSCDGRQFVHSRAAGLPSLLHSRSPPPSRSWLAPFHGPCLAYYVMDPVWCADHLLIIFDSNKRQAQDICKQTSGGYIIRRVPEACLCHPCRQGTSLSSGLQLVSVQQPPPTQMVIMHDGQCSLLSFGHANSQTLHMCSMLYSREHMRHLRHLHNHKIRSEQNLLQCIEMLIVLGQHL